MAKRVADKQLTQDTFDEEDEPVEAGVFQQANVTDLKGRVIRKARRSLPGNNSAISPFAGFLGLSKGTSPFIVSNGKGRSPMTTSTPLSTQSVMQPKTTVPSASGDNPNTPTRDPEYFRSLKALNEQFVTWVKLHMEKSSYADFTPVCEDYEKHARSLEIKYPLMKSGEEAATSKDNGIKTLPTQDTTSPKKLREPFSFGFKTNNTNTQNPIAFSFGAKTTPASLSTKPVGVPASFSFAPQIAAANKTSTLQTEPKPADDDNYEPPKNDFTPVMEKDALLSQRCKLFYKKDGNFTEKGIGILYLKPSNGKTQLLVRADTSLGNILLNIILSSSIPTSRVGKNNVLINCLPNPPLPKVEPEPTSFLIRVKTSEEADSLLKKMEELKKA